MGVRLAPITSVEMPEVARFLHAHLNRRIPPSRWSAAVAVPWDVEQPNHGFLLRDGDDVVGAYLAYYSRRSINGRDEEFCNLGAWCVAEGQRQHGARLLMRLLGQDGYHFTDFSPSGNVIPLNRRLKFVDLDTTTTLLTNWPAPHRGAAKVTSCAETLAATLTGEDLRLYEDHRRAAGAHHLLVSSAREHCYVIFRRESRKNVRAFGSILHVSNPELFRAASRQVASHLLTRHGVPATLVEHRVAGGPLRHGTRMRRSRPKMYRSKTLPPHEIDYLYSELTCLAW